MKREQGTAAEQPLGWGLNWRQEVLERSGLDSCKAGSLLVSRVWDKFFKALLGKWKCPRTWLWRTGRKGPTMAYHPTEQYVGPSSVLCFNDGM